MSSGVRKYRIYYDSNAGPTDSEDLYCKYENVWNGQLWRYKDGSSVNFDCLTDSHAQVMAMCIAGIPTEDKYFYWEEIKEFELPEAVAETFNYHYHLYINNGK